jgi:signal transduction histidine kinase
MPNTGGEQPAEAGLSLNLSIRDDGRGFDPAKISHERLGLGIMQERAQAIGALLTIESQPGQGTLVSVLWKQAKESEEK